MNNDHTIIVGQIVKVLQGRDAGYYAIIIEQIDDRFVLIADGHHRRVEKAKKKNRNHLYLTGFTAEEVKESLLRKGRINNAKLRYALDRFTEEQMKGEM